MNPDDIFFATVKEKDRPTPVPLTPNAATVEAIRERDSRSAFVAASLADWPGSIFVITTAIFFFGALFGIWNYS